MRKEFIQRQSTLWETNTLRGFLEDFVMYSRRASARARARFELTNSASLRGIWVDVSYQVDDDGGVNFFYVFLYPIGIDL